VSWEWTKKKMEDGVDLPADITGARNVPTFRPGKMTKTYFPFSK
jgi:hypothetical protein